MWSDHVFEDLDSSEFKQTCQGQIDHYSDQLNHFTVIVRCVKKVFKKYKLSDAITLARCTLVQGDQCIFLRWFPEYAIPRNSLDYDGEEALAHQHDYGIEFSIHIHGVGENMTGQMVFNIRNKENILTGGTGIYSYADFAKQQMPEWFVSNLKNLINGIKNKSTAPEIVAPTASIYLSKLLGFN